MASMQEQTQRIVNRAVAARSTGTANEDSSERIDPQREAQLAAREQHINEVVARGIERERIEARTALRRAQERRRATYERALARIID